MGAWRRDKSAGIVSRVTSVSPPSTAPVAASPAARASITERIVRAAADVIARQGLRVTSVDDIAIEAGCGRATVYRAFSGGRAELLVVALSAGVDQVFAECSASVDAAPTLSDAIVAAVHTGACALDRHDTLQRLVVDEPGVILPFISFDRLAPLLERSTVWGAEHFSRFLPTATAGEVGEWCARVVLDHLRAPGAVSDVTDPAAARHLVEAYLMPGLTLALPSDPSSVSTVPAPTRSN
jgi:AcrR family transcriptional regulator